MNKGDEILNLGFFDWIKERGEYEGLLETVEEYCPFYKWDDANDVYKCYEYDNDNFSKCLFDDDNDTRYVKWLMERADTNRNMDYCTIQMCDLIFVMFHDCFDRYWEALSKNTNMTLGDGVVEFFDEHFAEKKDMWQTDILIVKCMKD